MAVGSVTQSVAVDLVGNSATGAIGSVGVTSTTSVSGNATTGDVGTVLAEVISFQDITGVEGTGAVDSALAVIEVAITGVESVCSIQKMTRLGWGAYPDNQETWSPQSDTTETWTSISPTTNGWGAVSDTSESWTDLSDNSVTWQEAA